MSSEQDDAFSPRNLAVLGGLLFTALILGEAVFPRHSGDTASVSMTVDDIAMRLEPVVTLASIQANATASTGGEVADMSPQQLYQGACMACHAAGVAGAPKTGRRHPYSLSRGSARLFDAVTDPRNQEAGGSSGQPPNEAPTADATAEDEIPAPVVDRLEAPVSYPGDSEPDN